MAKSKTQADPGESRIGKSPASAPSVDRRKAGGKSSDARRGKPKVGKRDVGGAGRKALH